MRSSWFSKIQIKIVFIIFKIKVRWSYKYYYITMVTVSPFKCFEVLILER